MTTMASAVSNARKSLELEGFIFTKEEIVLMEQVAREEKATKDMLALADSYVEKLRKTNPEAFAEE